MSSAFRKYVSLVFLLLMAVVLGARASHSHTDVSRVCAAEASGVVVSADTHCPICDFTFSSAAEVLTSSVEVVRLGEALVFAPEKYSYFLCRFGALSLRGPPVCVA